MQKIHAKTLYRTMLLTTSVVVLGLALAAPRRARPPAPRWMSVIAP